MNSSNQPQLPEADIIYHQHGIVAVNKPGGLLSQGPPGIDSLELRVKRWRSNMLASRTRNYLGVIHRLDRPASGLMILATDKKTTAAMGKLFEQRQVNKLYWAMVEGKVQPDNGTWIDYMRKLPDTAKSEKVAESLPHAQRAELSYRLRYSDEQRSLLEIKLLTGRTHQIRLQSSSRGHPVLGDQLYGSTIQFGPQTTDLRKRWIALHALSIQFVHPLTQQEVFIEAETGQYWQGFHD